MRKVKKLRLRGSLIALYSFLRMGNKEGGANFFSLVSRGLTHGTGSELFQERFRFDIRKCFFTKKLVKKASYSGGQYPKLISV